LLGIVLSVCTGFITIIIIIITEEIDVYFSDGFQAMPARPSDKGKMETK
jgi:hypothetical protein